MEFGFNGILPRAKFTLHPPSLALSYWQCYCTAVEQWARVKLWGVEHSAPPIFGRATITLGIGPHSSLLFIKVTCKYHRHTPCLKKVPPLTCYNLHIHDPIKIIFGWSVTQKVWNNTMFCFPTSSIYRFCITLWNRKPKRQHTDALCMQHSPTAAAPPTSLSPKPCPNSSYSRTHWLQDLGSYTAARVWVVNKKIEEIKQLVEFMQCTSTAFEGKCIFAFPSFTR